MYEFIKGLGARCRVDVLTLVDANDAARNGVAELRASGFNVVGVAHDRQANPATFLRALRTRRSLYGTSSRPRRSQTRYEPGWRVSNTTSCSANSRTSRSTPRGDERAAAQSGFSMRTTSSSASTRRSPGSPAGLEARSTAPMPRANDACGAKRNSMPVVGWIESSRSLGRTPPSSARYSPRCPRRLCRMASTCRDSRLRTCRRKRGAPRPCSSGEWTIGRTSMRFTGSVPRSFRSFNGSYRLSRSRSAEQTPSLRATSSIGWRESR